MWSNRHLLNRAVVGVAVFLASSTAQAGSVLYVDDDAPPGGDGTSWDTAYRFLADALTDASGGGISEIHVAQGTYLPDRDEANPKGTGNREATFQLINGVSLMGGYAGLWAKDPDQHDIELYETILSGDLLGDDGPDFANNDENSFHVTTGSFTDDTAILNGFTITAGNADGAPPYSTGGGMYSKDANPTVTNCTFHGNWASELGGGMFNSASSPTVSNCTFAFNRAYGFLGPGGGGGMCNGGNSDPAVINSTFIGNAAGAGGGGGMGNFQNCDPTVINCTFSGNGAGGLYSSSLSSPMVINCIFWANTPKQIFDLGDTTVRFSDVQGGFAGVGNIDADPMFVAPGIGDYRLSSGSPCIDAGNNWGVPIDEDDYDQDGNTAELFPVDLDGNPRFNADELDFDPGCGIPVVVDMGAYEYQFDPVKEIIFADLTGDGAVGILDLLALLAGWGDPANNCLADLDIDGTVGILDLLRLLSHWG